MVNLIKLLALASLSYVVWFIIRDLLKPTPQQPGGSKAGCRADSTPQSKDDIRCAPSIRSGGRAFMERHQEAYTATVQLYHPDKVAGTKKKGPELQEVAES